MLCWTAWHQQHHDFQLSCLFDVSDLPTLHPRFRLRLYVAGSLSVSFKLPEGDEYNQAQNAYITYFSSCKTCSYALFYDYLCLFVAPCSCLKCGQLGFAVASPRFSLCDCHGRQESTFPVLSKTVICQKLFALQMKMSRSVLYRGCLLVLPALVV